MTSALDAGGIAARCSVFLTIPGVPAPPYSLISVNPAGSGPQRQVMKSRSTSLVWPPRPEIIALNSKGVISVDFHEEEILG